MVDSELFVSSPYKGSEHHLDLKSVDETSRLLAVALQNLRPIANDYQTEPYSESFNWQEIINILPSNFQGTYAIPVPQYVNSKGNSIALHSTQH